MGGAGYGTNIKGQVAICIEIGEFCNKIDVFCIQNDDLNANVKVSEAQRARALRHGAGSSANMMGLLRK